MVFAELGIQATSSDRLFSWGLISAKRESLGLCTPRKVPSAWKLFGRVLSNRMLWCLLSGLWVAVIGNQATVKSGTLPGSIRVVAAALAS
jgi:hypothetical protein